MSKVDKLPTWRGKKLDIETSIASVQAGGARAPRFGWRHNSDS